MMKETLDTTEMVLTFRKLLTTGEPYTVSCKVLSVEDSNDPLIYQLVSGFTTELMGYYVLNRSTGEIFKRDEKEFFYQVWDWNSLSWIDPRTLDDLKAQQWETIKAARTQAEYGGFTWDGSTFDSDAISQARLTGAVQLAQLNPALALDWTLASNTVRTLSAADLTAVGVALGVHVSTQFTKGQTLRAQIDAATTKEAVEAIVW